MAVALLLSHPNVKIDAITVVNGLAHVDAGARNMGRLLDLAGRKQVPVFAGRNAPMRGNAEFPAEWRKIADDLPGVAAAARIAAARNQARGRLFGGAPAETRARRFRFSRSARSPISPKHWSAITRWLRTFARSSSWAERCECRATFRTAACSTPGTAPPNGTFSSIRMAARIVFRSGVPIRLIALDATNKVQIEPRVPARIRRPRHTRRWARVVAGVLEADRETIDARHFLRLGSAGRRRAAAAEYCEDRRRCISRSNKTRPEEGRTVATPAEPTPMSPWTPMPPLSARSFLAINVAT